MFKDILLHMVNPSSKRRIETTNYNLAEPVKYKYSKWIAKYWR